MANNLSTQGSISIARLRSGDSLFVSLELNGIALYQGVDTSSGAVTPDWTVAGNQPIISPKVTSMRGNGVTLTGFIWKYVGVTLNFTGAESNGWTADSTGKFMMNATTGALKIIKNLASVTNIANDTLEFSCVATVGGVEYNITKTIDVMVQNLGASSYAGLLSATTEQLTSTVTSATITTRLLLAGAEISDYYVRWLKGDVVWSDKNGQKAITVTHDDVDGSQLIVAEFYKAEGDASPVFRAGMTIIDTKDEYIVVMSITSSNKEVDKGSPVTVSAKIINARTNAQVTPTNPKWSLKVMDKNTWQVLKSSATNTITVTTDETDVNGENDVEVVAEVTWDE